MQAACLTCGLGLTICLFKITSNTQGTTSFTLAPVGGKGMIKSIQINEKSILKN